MLSAQVCLKTSTCAARASVDFARPCPLLSDMVVSYTPDLQWFAIQPPQGSPRRFTRIVVIARAVQNAKGVPYEEGKNGHPRGAGNEEMCSEIPKSYHDFVRASVPGSSNTRGKADSGDSVPTSVQITTFQGARRLFGEICRIREIPPVR